jgi:hypothetical protein
MVIHQGIAVRLVSFVEDIGGSAYWWVETLFTDVSDSRMQAFKHHSTIKELHTRC